uniref:PP4R3 EVH1-like domain-containing protein n=1 Tax=Oncorhynchus kisutch TaxID=8019 RepID=A0A8C7M5N4_ONCKI
MSDTRRRVKVYTLNEDRQWDDRGTGHVSSTFVERLKGISLLVRAESNGSLLLESKIYPNTAYQKQQDTLYNLYGVIFNRASVASKIILFALKNNANCIREVLACCISKLLCPYDS